MSKISEIACFSPFHFHRIFSVIIGETPNAFINRIRLEKTASFLINSTDIPLNEIAFKYGFNSATAFSSAFKKYYGISPSEFRDNCKEQYSKIGKGKVTFEEYICNIDNIIKWIDMNAKVEVKEMSEIRMVYMSHVGDYEKIGDVYEKLFRWAGPKGILGSPQMKTITVYHDDPKVTKILQVRQSAGITVERDIAVDGEVGKMTVPGGKYAVGRFEISETEFGTAWDSMCVWVAEEGYN